MSLYLCKVHYTLNGVLIFIAMTIYPISHHAYLSNRYVYIEVASELLPVWIVGSIAAATAQ